MESYRFRITAFAIATLTVEERAITYQRSLYRARVPLANVRQIAVRRRRRGFFGMVASELVLATEPLPGVIRVLRWTIDDKSPEGRAALARVIAAVPGAVDLTGLPWRAAAARLAISPLTLRDTVMSRWGQAGTGALGAAAAMLVLDRVRQGAGPDVQLWVDLGLAGLGLILLCVGYLQARRETDLIPPT
jgi:hypothetical protein